MVTVIQEPGLFGPGFQQGMGALAQGLQQRGENQHEKQQLGFLQQALRESIGEDGQLNPQTLLDKALGAGINPQLAGQVMKMSGVGAKQELTPFQKKQQEKGADRFSELQTERSGLAQTKQSISRMKELSEETSGLGALGGITGMSGSAAEMTALGPQIIQPTLKILNPRGAIPQRKIEMVMDMATPKPGELKWKQQAKIKVAEDMARVADIRSQKELELQEKYQGMIPAEEMANLEKSVESEIDNIVSKSLTVDSLNQADAQMGDKYEEIDDQTGEPTGNTFVFNGKSWVKVK